MSGNSALIEFIRNRIAATGPVPFRWFMEQALYHPEHGYYASGKAAIGRDGDFFTSVSVGALFGKLLAGQFVEMWMRMGKPVPFTIVEQGAHEAVFARDVFHAIQAGSPECFAALRYCIIEPFDRLRERQRRNLRAFPQVAWLVSPEELQPFCGIHFSNELLDAMPVHLVRFSHDVWHECHVNAQLELVDAPVLSEALKARLHGLPKVEGYRTEINLDAAAWIGMLASKITRGYVLAIDYGYPHDVYYAPGRTSGTLACHTRHRKNNRPLESIGGADITAHVDFTSLAVHAIRAGWQLAGFTDQHHFMVGLGKNEFTDSKEPLSMEQQKSLRAFKTLMHPGLMGMAFKVIALQKEVDARSLRGFSHASDPARALGLQA